VERSFNF
jgi:Leucine-rich repeat (LRR) protein